jgi:hypothetical protein
MAAGTLTTLAIKDGAAASKTVSTVSDPNNSSALASRVCIDDALVTTATFSTGANSFTLPATPSDVIEVKGSATKTVRVKRITISGVATTAKQFPVQIIRRAASIADGTPVTPVITQWDSSTAAPTAVVRHFTTLGTPAAASPANSVMLARDITLTAPATAAAPLSLEFDKPNTKPIILRGAADCIVVNLGATALTAGEKLTYEILWSEDAS